MNVTVNIPDHIAERLGGQSELERRTLETLALSEYQANRLTRPELQKLLGFRTRVRLDGFLKEHGIIEGPTVEEVERQLATLDRLGL